LIRAAYKYLPGVKWKAESVITGDFSCRGRKQVAILGTTPADVVVAVFLNGASHRPMELRFRFEDTAKLEVEGLDYDPNVDLGYALEGFKRSKTCKGFSADDGATDPAHIYWNHKARQFGMWRN